MLQPLVQRACPSWCHADHSHQIHPADEMHWGELGTVAATELQVGVDGFDSHQSSVQIDVVVEQAMVAGAAYVSLIVDDLRSRSMRVTAHDARRLSLVLGRAANAAGA